MPGRAPGFARHVWPDGDQWIAEAANGTRTRFTLRTSPEHGTVDVLVTQAPPLGAYLRVLGNGTGSELVLTLLVPDPEDAAAVTRQQQIVDDELRAARDLAEGSPMTPPGDLPQPAFARESARTEPPHSDACPEGGRPAIPHAITLIRSASLSSLAEYAYAATAPAGSRLIFLAGACPLNEDGTTAATGDYASQAAKAFDNMRIALADAGASVEDVLSTRVLVASGRQQDLVAAWEVIRDSFASHDVPSTLIGVTALGYKDQLVEIEAVAAVLDS